MRIPRRKVPEGTCAPELCLTQEATLQGSISIELVFPVEIEQQRPRAPSHCKIFGMIRIVGPGLNRGLHHPGVLGDGRDRAAKGWRACRIVHAKISTI